MTETKTNLEKSYVSFRASDELINKMAACSMRDRVSRTDVILTALNHYLTSKKCIYCGAINPVNGHICSVCEHKLYEFADIEKAAISLAERDIYDIDSNLSEKVDKFESIGFKRVYDIELSKSVGEESVIYARISLDDGSGMILDSDSLDSYYTYSPELIAAEIDGDGEKIAELNNARIKAEGEAYQKYIKREKAIECLFNHKD